MQNETTFQKNLLDMSEAGAQKRFALLIDSHVQLGIRHAAFSVKVIADQVAPPGSRRLRTWACSADDVGEGCKELSPPGRTDMADSAHSRALPALRKSRVIGTSLII